MKKTSLLVTILSAIILNAYASDNFSDQLDNSEPKSNILREDFILKIVAPIVLPILESISDEKEVSEFRMTEFRKVWTAADELTEQQLKRIETEFPELYTTVLGLREMERLDNGNNIMLTDKIMVINPKSKEKLSEIMESANKSIHD